ncbi:SCO family protein KNAG_0K01320 [Huiozyma naganishii CBS 8797]|uniref:Thioredoxin domain-containing protein n=1 Tax=Huiozyma naganishii (strain ATCC MYA-139 / BCRC 22969 / CBS 8797 / KCTC 17520 / NBRC 10181 / NCYC 3082 / Yp74L-3) TaxID=1071383 RepID=J7S3B4_HUIN7|nr:hypothetical protein KNAG_0K01320 [Kazachstania naganishii CBS 8797]CCK72497.1 hypothetical protein KNAG_0K01320 [Kazachstania naganishii CBS 8797]
MLLSRQAPNSTMFRSILSRNIVQKSSRLVYRCPTPLISRMGLSVSARTNQLSRTPVGGSESKKGGGFKESTVEFSAGKATLLFLIVGGLSYYIFEREKKRLESEQHSEDTRGFGRPQIGGNPFDLTDQDGNKFTEQNLLGKFSLVYFGFSHCPDICPDELDKLGVWLDTLKKDNIKTQPIFVTCDPARDSPEVLKEYLKDFHEGIVGLTGSYDDIKKMCKQYRVYFSTPPDVKPGQDYLVDHSVFFYLMDPEGQFVEAIGLNYDETSGAEKIKQCVRGYLPKAEREKLAKKNKSFWW